jgi:enoyl-CoA hydratase
MSELVLVKREPPMATVTLNRPRELNALSDALLRDLVAVLGELDADPDIGCVVVAGSDRAFAAGADIRELAATTPVELYGGDRTELWAAIREVRTPLVAAVSGHCLGGGCELAMCCDLIVAADSARFAQPETSLGLTPGAGGTQRLARAVGKALAMDMVLSGRTLTAEEALAAGLVARVTSKDRWLLEAQDVARTIAERSPLATRLAKESVDRAFEVPLRAGLEAERHTLYLALADGDASERIHAFLHERERNSQQR